MFDNLLNALERNLKNPITFIFAVIATIGTLVSVIVNIYELFSHLSSPLNWIISLILLFITIITIMIFAILINFRLKYKIPLGKRYIFTNVQYNCHINQNKTRHIFMKKTFFFFENPQKEDLFDNHLTSLKFNFNKMDFISKDSKIIEVQNISDNLLKIFWKPNIGNIEIGIPYEHESECTYPKQNLIDNKIILVTYSTSCFVKKITLNISSEIDINTAIVYRKRFGQSLEDTTEIIKKAKNIKKPLAPPIQFIDKKSLKWENENISSEEMFFIIVYLIE